MPWVQAATSITSGLDADKPAIPAIGDMYGATDTQKLYVCFTAGTWTKVSYLANSSSGTLANLPASPQVGDTYFVTDLNIQAACFTAGVWTTVTKRTKTGQFTIDTSTESGNQVVTGVGFKPNNVLFIVCIIDVFRTEMSIGHDSGTSRMVLLDNTPNSADTYSNVATFSIYLFQAVGIYYTGKVVSMDDDGFTVQWAKTGAKTGLARILYMAYEG